MQKFEWIPFLPVDFEKLKNTRIHFHQALQAISEVGRRFLSQSEVDGNAALIWVPGLSRLAGKWVKGKKSFRASISFDSFSIYLVDHKVSTLAKLNLQDKNSLQVMVWLEEQLVKLGLEASNLVMKPPYDLPQSTVEAGELLQMEEMSYSRELGKYFHNSYVSIRDIKHQLKSENVIYVWPHHFDQVLEITVKDSGDPETNTRIKFGMSPGDQKIRTPYFYVNCWPHANVKECGKLQNGAYWVSEDWTGAILESKEMLRDNQKQVLDLFYKESSDALIDLLTK